MRLRALDDAGAAELAAKQHAQQQRDALASFS